MDKRKVRRQLRVLFKDVKRHMDEGGRGYPVGMRNVIYTCLIVSALLNESAYDYYSQLLKHVYGDCDFTPFCESALVAAGYTDNYDKYTLQNPLRAAWINKLARYVPNI